jgi:transcriptional regulator with XRE-family HTH domain
MSGNEGVGIGKRIKRFRMEKGMSAAELADAARISRSYLSELESGKGGHKRLSAQVMYKLGKALGISMSELLGRPLITAPPEKQPASLKRFAKKYRVPKADIDMLASIRFRGDPPQTDERWSFIYNAIKNSTSMDPPPRRRSSG